MVVRVSGDFSTRGTVAAGWLAKLLLRRTTMRWAFIIGELYAFLGGSEPEVEALDQGGCVIDGDEGDEGVCVCVPVVPSTAPETLAD